MADRLPQFDLPRDIDGASDAWDDRIVGAILTAEFFGAPLAAVAGTGAGAADATGTSSGAVIAAAIQTPICHPCLWRAAPPAAGRIHRPHTA